MIPVLDQILDAFHARRDTLLLDGQNLTELPPQIGMLTELEVLSLSGNQLTRLPVEIGNMSNLVELALDENRLTWLTPAIGRLASLQILLLSSNKLRSLPAALGDLASLQKLNLDQNQLRRLPPEIAKLTRLRRLNIQNNRLTELPAEFAQLESLRDFDWEKLKSGRLPPRNVRNFIADGNPWIYPPPEIMKKQVHEIRDYLKTNPPDRSQIAPYVVLVDDNSLHDENHRRFFDKVETFFDCQSAIAACKKIIDEFLAARAVTHGSGTAQELLHSYRQFGEEPFIVTRDAACVFSGSEYAQQRCRELAEAITLDPASLDNPLLNGNGMNQARWGSPPSPDSQSNAAEPWTPPVCPLPPPLPRITFTRMLKGAPYGFSFESRIDVPARTEPHIEARLRKEFPECKWQDHAENWDKVRIQGISTNAPLHLDIWIGRNESPGPFHLTVAIATKNQSEAEQVHQEVIRRLTWALIGWSSYPLPHFKPRTAAVIDKEAIVELPPLLEGPHIIIAAFQADILITRTFVEALSLHREVLAPCAGDDPENRAALLRGNAAGLILRQSVSTDTTSNLYSTPALVRQAHPLLAELLQLGLAQVVQYGPANRAPGAPSFSPARIKLQYFGNYISCSAADGEAGNLGEFLRLYC